eukprot:CAMPEP_0170913846 /NCGR_PEP_ID=MMETSP0735-20130129/5229_1 /TAXON_ID=186038 /ORGANISM="Fragilariopsis kerguelensis, Strain L26-C5" /LENGTH=132 /DNA_ID=CAMNT_0011311409 /DNA_START=927 /DNA_END=1325 /DNA_ORIENTATION=+
MTRTVSVDTTSNNKLVERVKVCDYPRIEIVYPCSIFLRHLHYHHSHYHNHHRQQYHSLSDDDDDDDDDKMKILLPDDDEEQSEDEKEALVSSYCPYHCMDVIPILVLILIPHRHNCQKNDIPMQTEVEKNVF